jgi:ABC-type hemin transport system ATPase subunit
LCLKDGRIHCEGTPQEINTPQTLHQIFGKDSSLFAHEH